MTRRPLAAIRYAVTIEDMSGEVTNYIGCRLICRESIYHDSESNNITSYPKLRERAVSNNLLIIWDEVLLGERYGIDAVRKAYKKGNVDKALGQLNGGLFF